MKRYSQFNAGIEEWDDGEYVLHEEVQPLLDRIKDLEAQLATPAPTVTSDFRERFKDAYETLSVAAFSTPFWNQSMGELLAAVDTEIKRRTTAPAPTAPTDRERRWAKHLAKDDSSDLACAECYPHGHLLKSGYKCIRHDAIALLAEIVPE